MNLKGRNVTAGRLIAELNFGFWNSLFETHHYALLKGAPCTIFKSLPADVGRKEVNLRIQKIRGMRNRISHNEPLCFCGKKYDIAYVDEMYIIICELLTWINPSIVDSLECEGLNKVFIEIKSTKEIIESSI